MDNSGNFLDTVTIILVKCICNCFIAKPDCDAYGLVHAWFAARQQFSVHL